MEKLGVEKEQLKSELQAEYGRLIQRQSELRKEADATTQTVLVTNEIEEIKSRLDDLSKD
jgi:hypothetical protein